MKNGRYLSGGGRPFDKVGAALAVDRHAPPFEVHHAECELRLSIAATGRQAIPGDRFLKVARNAITSFVDKPQKRLRCDVAGGGTLDRMAKGSQVVTALKRAIGQIEVGARRGVW